MTTKTAGVYTITNTSSKSFYEGRSVFCEGRWYTHRSKLRNGTHKNTHLQNAWNKEGEDAFRFTIRQRCSKADLVATEQGYLDMWFMVCPEMLYNIARTSDAPALNRKVSDATKARMSAAKLGKRHSATHKARMSAAKLGNTNRTGYKCSEATKTKMGLAKLGNTYRWGITKGCK